MVRWYQILRIIRISNDLVKYLTCWSLLFSKRLYWECIEYASIVLLLSDFVQNTFIVGSLIGFFWFSGILNHHGLWVWIYTLYLFMIWMDGERKCCVSLCTIANKWETENICVMFYSWWKCPKWCMPSIWNLLLYLVTNFYNDFCTFKVYCDD